MNTNNKKIVNTSDLADAIVAQACEDYRDAIRGNCADPNKMLRELMRFFKSEYYQLLTKIDYHYLLEKLNTEWEEGRKLIEVGMDVECPKLKKHYKFNCPLCGWQAETHVKRLKTPKRKDGSRTVSYYKVFTCKCHRPEQILLKQEVIYEDNQNRPTERT